MGRPKSKPELLKTSQANFDKLFDFIEKMDEDEQLSEFPTGTMNRNISDVLMHLHHWHLMLLDWYKVGMTGKKPDMPAKGYTWKSLPDLNRLIWEKYESIDLEESKKLMKKSHEEVQKMIEQHTNEELFEKKRYIWTGTTSMGAYFISATSSHYDWAYKLIKKAKR